MLDYKIIIEVWPFSTGRGHVADRAEVWPRVREFLVQADSFNEACKIAEYMKEATARHHMVWHANVRTVTTWPMLSAAENESEKPATAKA